MKVSHLLINLCLVVACTATNYRAVHAETPPRTSFTYQGQLRQGGSPVAKSVDLSFELFDEKTGGNQIGPTVLKSAVMPVNGRFAVKLDFGQEAFGARALWLEVAVRVPHDADDVEPFVVLEPRQPVTPVPMALQTRGLFVDEAGNLGLGTADPNFQLSLGSGLSHTKVALYETGPDNHYGVGVVPGQMSFHLNGSGARYAFYDSSDRSNQIFSILGSGRVGIGTTSPSKQLSVAAGAAIDQDGLQDGTMRDRMLTFGGPTSREGITSKRTPGGNQFGLDFYTKSVELGPRMSITHGGNVGIGTTSPTTPLAIRGPSGLTDVGIAQNNVGGRNTMELTTADEFGNQRTRMLLRGGESDGVEFYRGNAGDESLSVSIEDNGNLEVHGGRIRQRRPDGEVQAVLRSTLDAGELFLWGANGEPNVRVSYRGASSNLGEIAIYDDTGQPQVNIATTSFGGDGGYILADQKNFRVPNPDLEGTDIVYACVEGPEAAAYIRGTERLERGEAEIVLPDHFREVAVEAGMTVQVTPLSAESLGLAVVEKSLDGIIVQELRGGDGTYEFDYLVTAVRKGFEDYRVIRPSLEGP